MDLATLFVRFKADTSDVDAKVKSMEANTKAAGTSISSTLAKAFSAAVIGAGIKKTITAASDLNETVSKTEVIFGNASTAIEKAGDTAARSMGLSKTAYLDAASSLKGLLDNMGLAQNQSTEWSQKLVQLGSDLGSFFNKDPEVAIEAIGSALRGETEPIRAFNVQISDAAVKAEALKLGLYDGVGALDANARAQATLSLIMQQTTAAQGDFARTADGAANSQRIARAEMENSAASIGQAFLPVYTKVVQLVGDAARVFGELPGPVQTALIAMLGFVALSGPISKTIEAVGGITKAISALGASAGPIGLAVAALALLAAAVLDTDNSQAQVSARAKEVAGNLAKETDEIVQQRIATGQATTATQSYADAQTALSAALTGTDEDGQRLAKALGGLGFQAGEAAQVIGLLQVQAGTMAQSQEDLATASENGAGAAHLAAISQRDLAVQLLVAKGVSEDVARVLVEAGQGASYMGDAADVTKDKTKGWSDENKALLASIIEVGRQAGNTNVDLIAKDYLDAEVASSAFRASLVAQAEAQTGASRAGADAEKVYDAYLQILENLNPAQAANLQLTDQQVQTNTALASSFDDAERAAAEYQVRQDQLEARQTANADATQKLKDALEDTGEVLYDASDAAKDLSDALDKLLGKNIDVEEANRALEEGIDGVTASIKENGATLDIGTEKGRANRSAIEDQVKAIQDKIEADVASGVAVGEATNAGLLYRQQLIDTAVQSGLSRQAAEDYVNQLGLTPENVTTAVELQHDEEVKTRLQGVLDKLGDIDAGAAAEIQALIDNGSLDEAAVKLDAWARNHPAVVAVKISGNFSSGDVAGGRGGARSAYGRYVPAGTNLFTSVAEPGAGDEVILPLDNPGRIRQLLAGNGVGSRIFDAVGGIGSSAAASTGSGVTTLATSSSSVTGLHVEHLEIHSDTDAEGVAQVVMFKLAAVS